ncbi:MAG: flavodoxin family protein [Methanobacterium sp.]|uniref:flavodoxin family protein n=1 Tax=Methanobacterium sp. TaxID=2164 RepID=UPI003D648EEA|nr:flavodoxin family protein [Methanobacterium sp.]
MKTAIIYKSIHHGNTKKIAEAMVNALEAELFDLKDANHDIIKEYDLIGFGSGIYFSKPHKKLRKFVEDLDNVENKKAFVFSTSGSKKPSNAQRLGHRKSFDFRASKFNDLLKNELSKKGFEILGEFNCKGFDTWGPFKLIGGLNKGKPDEEDLKNAAEFAKSLK